MTDTTKQLFDAPWRVDKVDFKSDMYGVGSTIIRIFNKNEELITAYIPDEKTANRISHLPELYDALMHFVVNDCPHAFISNDECRLCPDKKCIGRKWVSLLRKVRDGE